jgi:hypothetical protein
MRLTMVPVTEEMTRRHAAAQQRLRQRPAKPQLFRDPGADAGAQMHHRPLAARGGAGAQRHRADKRRADAIGQAHPPTLQRARLHHVGDAQRPLARHQEFDDQPDRQPAGGKPTQDMPPGDVGDEGDDPFRRKTIEQQLHRPQPLAKGDRRTAADAADHYRQGRQHDLLVPGKPVERAKDLAEIGQGHGISRGLVTSCRQYCL